MGIGNDTINALNGGFGGTGKYYLGLGNDTVRGFGTGTFYGQGGFDQVFLPEPLGNYTIVETGSIFLIGKNYTITSVADPTQTMTLIGFDQILQQPA